MKYQIMSLFCIVVLSVGFSEITEARMVGKPQTQAAVLKCIDVKTPSGCEICCGEGDFNECQSVPCSWLNKVTKPSASRSIPNRPIDPRSLQQ